VLCRGLEKNGIVGAWHGHGMASVNQTRPHCVSQMGKTHSEHLVAQHGRGTAWALHAMCESAFNRYANINDDLKKLAILNVRLRTRTYLRALFQLYHGLQGYNTGVCFATLVSKN